jgi:peptidyl-prolyl cis-trans isomerase A (cyclophilin A)
MRTIAVVIALGLAAAACSKTEEPAGKDPSSSKPAANTPGAAPVAAGALDPAKLTEKAPDAYKAKFVTTKGSFVIEVKREWAPNGADRFYNMVKAGFFNGVKFFRAVDGFMVQFGIHGDPTIAAKWRDANIKDDPVKQSNKKGWVSFATRGPDTRTTQIFVNYGDNARLDGMGFSPFGQVTSGMDVVDSLYKGYGEGAPQGMGPEQGRIQSEGNAYLEKEFPKLDAVKEATIEK